MDVVGHYLREWREANFPSVCEAWFGFTLSIVGFWRPTAHQLLGTAFSSNCLILLAMLGYISSLL